VQFKKVSHQFTNYKKICELVANKKNRPVSRILYLNKLKPLSFI